MSPDNLEARVTKLESQSRDELRDFRRATTASFNALREDLTDLRGYVDGRFDQVDGRFSQVDNGFIEIRGKLDAAATGQQHIVELLERLIADQG
jgi:hypothetical protein